MEGRDHGLCRRERHHRRSQGYCKIIHKTLNRRQRRRRWRRGIDPGWGILLVGHPTEHMAVVEAHDDQTVLELRMEPGLLLIWNAMPILCGDTL